MSQSLGVESVEENDRAEICPGSNRGKKQRDMGRGCRRQVHGPPRGEARAQPGKSAHLETLRL